MYRTALATLLLVLATAGVLHADPTPAALAPRTPPANATRLASGVAWVTLVAGHGPHPRATDWVLTYGGTSHSERQFYYSPSPRDAARFATFIAFTDMAIGEKRRYWLPDGSVEDIEIVAVVPRDRVNSHPMFPAPSDALVGTHGERYVVIEAAKPGTHIEPADRVMMRVVAFGDDDYVKLAIPEGRVTVDDITVPPVAAAVRAMGSGERRMIWTTYLGKPLWLYIEMFSVEHRPQIAPPAGFAQIPGDARAASGAHYIVLEQGTGEPPDRVDGVTLDYAMWTLSGRTIESTATNLAQTAEGFSFESQLVDMRVGEHRRIWLQPELTTKYPEAGAGAVVDVRLVAIHRQLSLLPHGLRVNTDGDGAVVLSRGATRVFLGLAMRRLETMALSGDTVTFNGETHCDMPATETRSVAELDAIIDATEALQLAAAGKNTEAIHGLVSAIAHTRAPGELQFQLAAVQVRAGNPHDAAITLAAIAARDPVTVFMRLAVDHTLAPLAGDAALARFRAPKRGKVDLAKMPVMLDPSRRFAAVPIDEASWGSGDSETRVEIIDLDTQSIIATIPHVMWALMSEPMTPAIEAEVAARKRQVEAVLEVLGFASAAVEIATIDDDRVAHFARAGITIDADLNVTRAGQRIAQAAGVGHPLAAYWLRARRTLVIASGRAGHEGCEGTDPRSVSAMKLP
jgi:hypothetical protein